MKPRKFQSGYNKLLKRRRIEQLTQSQKGALEKFIVSKPRDVVANSNNVIELDDTNKNDQPSNVEELSDNNKNEDLVDDWQNNVEELSINNINEDLVNDQQNNAEELSDNNKKENLVDDWIYKFN